MPMIPSKEVNKGVAIAEPVVKEHDVDLLIVGGGMGACGVAYEAVRWGEKHNLKIMLCDKAALERSGAVAQGLSAINTYLGKNSADDYVRMVRTDLMGLVREDLIFDVGRHVDDSVHLFEDWGLPCWIKDENGHNMNGAAAKAAGKSLRKGDDPVRSGRWQIMINGESYKCIVAEAAKNALGEDRIMERIFIVKLLLDANTPNRIAGAVGFNLRANEVHIFKANTIMVAAGGAVNVYRPRSTGEGMGRAWYPVWNAGSTYTMCAQVGAEMTMMENRFVPARFKDGYGPVGAWFLLFKAKASLELARRNASCNFLGLFTSGAMLAKLSRPKISLAMPACSASGSLRMASNTVMIVFSASGPPFFMPSAKALTLRMPIFAKASFCVLDMASPWAIASRKDFMAVAAASGPSEVETKAPASPTMLFADSPAVTPTAPTRDMTSEVLAAVALVLDAR